MELTARLVGHLDSTDERMVADLASHRDELRQQRTADAATTLTPMNVYGGLGCPVVGSMGSPFGQAAPTHNTRGAFGNQKWIRRIAMRIEPSLAVRACDRFGIPGVDSIDDLVVEDREHGIQVFLGRVTDLHVWCGLPCRLTDQASAALKGAAERAEPEVVEAKRYSRNWRQALQRPTACRCWAALSPNWDIRVGPSDQ